eukprot:gnl/MRDRNA2_/MRDRNA2_114898_c0_seq1.p1 gnl/MRDRNA2_/MRDRNA2_114898_c0~~gnl/MRDRNA2_/MRDRNA2_114898_c0_seq1.p1  ORF type:complete len:147 (-),score=32.13 gnl/MRDRNA2_/MRDRNA2_114898_c0_seq1:23-463(-)
MGSSQTGCLVCHGREYCAETATIIREPGPSKASKSVEAHLNCERVADVHLIPVSELPAEVGPLDMATTDEMLAADAYAMKARISLLRDSLPPSDEFSGPDSAVVEALRRKIATAPLWNPRTDEELTARADTAGSLKRPMSNTKVKL